MISLRQRRVMPAREGHSFMPTKYVKEIVVDPPTAALMSEAFEGALAPAMRALADLAKTESRDLSADENHLCGLRHR
jgi:hypothetical protein